MAQDKVIIRRSGHQVLDELDAADIPDLSAAYATPAAVIAYAQALNSNLTAIAALATTSYGRSLLEAANAAALRTLAGLVIGTNVQAFDAELAAIAGLTSAADKAPYFTGSGAAALADLTAAGRALIDDASALAQRATLDLALVVPQRPPIRTGLYYPSWDGAFSTLVLTQSTQYAVPFYIPDTITVDRIGVLASGVASSSVNLAIYSDTAGVPDALVLDAGNAVTTSTAIAEKTISQSLTRGWYWLACAVQGAAGSIFSNANGASGSKVPVASPFSSFFAGGYSRTGVTGAAPSPWGATKTETIRLPVMLLRFA